VSSGARSDFKELVRARTNIVQLVGERITLQSRQGGREFVGLCPFHDDHTPSLRVNPERQSYKCWACGEGGDCFAFVQKIENVPFAEALELLATRANLEMPARGQGDGRTGDGSRSADGRPTKKESLDVLTWAENEYHTFLRTASEADVARDYLESRGFTRETIDRFRLGYAPLDGQFLQRRGHNRFNPARLAAVRLVSERQDGEGFYDYFRGRVLFPIRDASGRTVAFGGRVLPGVGPANAPKYVNSPDSPLFAKNRLLFALDNARDAIKERDAALVMEGYADCIMAHQFGIANAVATLGTALTDNHVSALKRFTRKVILVFDGDEAGRKAAERSLPRFLAQDVDLRILTLTDAKDPADFLVARGTPAFQNLIASASEAWEYKLGLCIERIGVGSVDAREQIVAEMLDLFRQAPQFGGSARENIVLNRLAFRVGLSETRIREMLVANRRKAPAASATGRTLIGNQTGAGQQTGGDNSQQNSDRLESELLEIILADPATVRAIRDNVAVEDFRNDKYRRLLELCYQLTDEGSLPSYEKLIAAAEEPELNQLVVTLDESARHKEVSRKLHFDPPTAHGAARQAFLFETLGMLKRRRSVEAHEVSKGRLATQSGNSGTLDPSQLELLRHAAAIHGERAKAKTTT